MRRTYLPSAPTRRHLIILSQAYALGTIAVTTFLFAAFLGFSDRRLVYMSLSGVPVSLLVMGVDWWIVNRQCRPMDCLDEVASALATEEQLRFGVERAVNMPAFTVFRIMCIHGPLALTLTTAATLTLMNPLLRVEFEVWKVEVLWLSMFITVPAHAIMEYFCRPIGGS